MDIEATAWAWLSKMVEAICDEEPADIAYSADQMVDAYMAGHKAALDAARGESADERKAAIVARLGPGEFFADGDRFDLVFRPGGGSYSGADVIVGRFACGDTAYWLPGLVAELLNREWRR